MEDAYGHSASLDATGSCPALDDQEHYPINIARRSLSIFSRRGTMTPEPTFRVTSEAVHLPVHMSDKQRSWLLRKRSSHGSVMSLKSGRFKSPRGTILHAVPSASINRLSALEEEMAQSPNEEILSAISESSPTPRESTNGPRSSSDGQGMPERLSSFKAKPQRDSSLRIGVWVDGVVHWNEGSFDGCDLGPARSSASKPEASRQKPCLSVTIPNGETRPSARTIYQPRPHRPRLDTMLNSGSVILPMDRPRAPLRKYSPELRISGSSTSSSSGREDASMCSNRSSVTSIATSAIVVGSKICSSNETTQLTSIRMYEYKAQENPTASDNSTWLHRNILISRRKAPCSPATQDRPVDCTGCTRPSAGSPHSQDPMIRLLRAQDADTASPTWSEAERDLQLELSTEHDHHDHAKLSVARTDIPSGGIRRSGSVREVMQPPSRAPTIPKRSRKREWRTHVAYPASQLQRRQSDAQQCRTALPKGDPALRKTVSVSCAVNPVTTTLVTGPSAPLPPKRSARRPVSYISANSSHINDLGVSRRKAVAAAMMPTTSAEDVLLHILARLRSPQDLFNTAIINKGMYRVFRENEIHLLRTVVFNESPALWELLEWSPPHCDELDSSDDLADTEHSPVSYMRCYQRGRAVMVGLRKLILENCQSFLRRETVIALSTPTHPNAQRYNDAFWRIWTFCQIFGSVKNREDDITGQMDWLKGGVLANNEDCIASTEPNMDFDLRSVLISPPACFAESNRGGLSATRLFDMTEIWTCMTALLQDYHGRVGQARYYGVFDQCEVEEGDDENEAAILEEWTAYLLTLGPSVVFEMAQLYPAAGFALAKDNGWTRWTPPIHDGSRSSFLKEPVAKSYEEQVTIAYQLQQDPREQVRKDASRRRVATLAAEIRVRRQSSAYKRSPLIDMTTERAMSMSSRRDSVSPTRVHHSQEASHRITSAPMTLSSNQRHSSAFLSPPDDRSNQRDVSRSAEDTGEHAVQQLVAMGFERELAIDALRITDRGDGFCPDRAVDLLLRNLD